MSEMLKNKIKRTCIMTVVGLVLLGISRGQITHEMFEKQRGSCPQDSLLWTDTNSRSNIHCVVQCKESDSCYIITINSVSRVCKYYGVGGGSGPLMGCVLANSGDEFIVVVKIIPGCGEPSFAGYTLGTPTSTDVGGTVSVYCPNGYVCGSSVMTCQANGEWEQPLGCASSDDHLVGCYQDNSPRAFPISGPASAMTPGKCIQYCVGIGYGYAAVQAGYQCFCGPANVNYYQYGIVDMSECHYACSGDTGQTCGGHWVNQVYTVGTC